MTRSPRANVETVLQRVPTRTVGDRPIAAASAGQRWAPYLRAGAAGCNALEGGTTPCMRRYVVMVP